MRPTNSALSKLKVSGAGLRINKRGQVAAAGQQSATLPTEADIENDRTSKRDLVQRTIEAGE